MNTPTPWRLLAVLCITLMACVWPASQVQARDTANATVATSALPAEGRAVLQRIAEGGPFRYSRDGVVFGNRERQLPQQPRGYYREYTVATPGAHNRGARRIICGGERRTPDACWYTDDHYVTFRKIDR